MSVGSPLSRTGRGVASDFFYLSRGRPEEGRACSVSIRRTVENNDERQKRRSNRRRRIYIFTYHTNIMKTPHRVDKTCNSTSRQTSIPTRNAQTISFGSSRRPVLQICDSVPIMTPRIMLRLPSTSQNTSSSPKIAYSPSFDAPPPSLLRDASRGVSSSRSHHPRGGILV